jgi:hypothetical protein
MQVLQHEVAFRSHKKTLLTYAKKVTVSVLYWYARSFRYIRQSLDTTPKGVDFFLVPLRIPNARSTTGSKPLPSLTSKLPTIKSNRGCPRS